MLGPTRMSVSMDSPVSEAFTRKDHAVKFYAQNSNLTS